MTKAQTSSRPSKTVNKQTGRLGVRAAPLFSGRQEAALTALRKTLDFLYLAAGVAAALCLIAILLLIVAQMVARWTGENLFAVDQVR